MARRLFLLAAAALVSAGAFLSAIAVADLQPLGANFPISTTGADGDANRSAFSPVTAHNPSANEYLVVWEADGLATDGEFEIFGQRLSASGAELGDDFRVSTTGADGDSGRTVLNPAIAYNPRANEYLVVWQANGLAANTKFEIFGQRLSATGAEIGTDFRISATGADADPNRDASAPAITYNSGLDEYLVSWKADDLATDDEFEIFVKRLHLGATGVEIGAEVRVSTTGADGDAGRSVFNPAIAYNPSADEYLVSWHADGLAAGNDFEIFAQRLSDQAVRLGANVPISTTGADGDANRGAFSPVIAHNPSANEYLVVWEAEGLATDGEFEIFGQRLSASGAELGGDFRISITGTDGDANRGALNPVIAHNPSANEYLVSWRANDLAAVGEFEIFGQRLSATGAAIGTDFRISVTGADGDVGRAASEPTIAHNPSADEYLVSWRANDLAAVGEFEIFGQRLGPPAPPTGGPPLGGPPAGGDGLPPQRAGKCAGKTATKTGSNRADVISGTAKRDVIAALGGNDVIRGLGGNDLLCGGGGKDKLFGGRGNDKLRGEAGRDLLVGGPGKDAERQ